MQVNEMELAAVVRRVMEQIERRSEVAATDGIFAQLDDAVDAAAGAQVKLSSLSREKRTELIAAMRQAALREAAPLAEMAVQETRMGRVQDKIAKNRLVASRTPGVEDLQTFALSGDHGLTTMEMAPFGVIGSITPVTNPTATVVNNAIGMVAAGNAVVFCPHPTARLTSNRTIEILNQAIVQAGGPANLLASVAEPGVEVADGLMKHPRIDLITATGGKALVKAALSSGKRAIGAGAGNPPAVVDETCDVRKAARDLIQGAGFDNNLPCIAEKVIIAVDAVADQLMKAMEEYGARRLSGHEADLVTNRVLTDDEGQAAKSCTGRQQVLKRLHVTKQFVGQDAAFILKEAGLPVAGDPKIAFMEVDREHPLVWLEQMMPVIPVVRVSDVAEAIRLAVEVERGNRHTAMIWSRNVETMTQFARSIKTTIFVKNGPSYAGIGLGGEGHTTFTIAGPTGEGLTSARTFTRQRRCILVDAFSIL